MRSIRGAAVAAVLSLVLSSGCAGTSPVGMGMIFTSVKGPQASTAIASTPSQRTGQSSCMNILGLIAIGDASVETAARLANITRIAHVDYETFGVLGLFTKYTTYVYGEGEQGK